MKANLKYYLLILILSFFFSLPMLRSGWISSEGMRLIGVNNSDGLWNLSLIEELKHHFPPEHPGFAGQKLEGYHFLYHFLLAIVAKVTSIPNRILYFQIFPILTAYLWGLGVYKVVLEWFKNRSAALWSVLFSFFGGSFAFIWLLFGQNVDLDNVFGISQPFGSTMVNPAFASSVVLVIWSFYFMLRYQKTKAGKWGVFFSITSGLSIGFKAYAGMILMGTLLVTMLKEVIIDKKTRLAPYFLLALGISLAVFLPFNAKYGFLVLYPFWPLKRMFHGPLNFTKYDELWDQYHYYSNYYGMFKIYLLGFFLFVIGNLGTRVAAVFAAWKIARRNLLNSNVVFYFSMLLISTLIPMFFIQPIGVFNMIQLYWYFLFLASLLTGPGLVFIAQKIDRSALRTGFYLLVIILTLPSNVIAANNYLRSPGSFVDRANLELLSYLREYGNYDSTVLFLPDLNTYDLEALERWFGGGSNLLIPAFGEKRLFVSDEVVQFPYELKDERLGEIEKIMRLRVNSYDLLKEVQTQLIVSETNIEWLDSWDKVELLFKNSAGKIYKVL